jgi:hypothetical protein
VDLIGKAAHIRTISVPDWVKNSIDDWLQSARIAGEAKETIVSRFVTFRSQLFIRISADDYGLRNRVTSPWPPSSRNKGRLS